MPTVFNLKEILLGGYRYPLVGPLRPTFENSYAQKFVIGDYDKDSDTALSTWEIIGDNRGGMLIDNMDETKDLTRYWYSNCNTRFRGSLRLGELATRYDAPSLPAIVNPGFESWTGSTIDTWATAGTVSKETSDIKEGVNAVNIGNGTSETYAAIQQTISLLVSSVRGKRWDIWGWFKTAAGGLSTVYNIRIQDDVGGAAAATDTAVSISASWQWINAYHTVDAAATTITIIISATDPGTDYVQLRVDNLVYGDGVGATPIGGDYCRGWAEFNGALYMSKANTLYSFTTAGGVVFEKAFPNTITTLVSSLNSYLYIFVGDTHSYFTLSTAGAYAQVNSGRAGTFAIQWDAKLFKGTAAGVWTYSTNPENAGATWTAAGDITDITSGNLRPPLIGSDASGEDIIYQPTTTILKAYDFTNTRWVDSKLVFSGNTETGYGSAYWKDGMYIGSGLDVVKYVPVDGTITSVGLSNNDGLPAEFDGTVRALISGNFNELVAVVSRGSTSLNTLGGIYGMDINGAWYQIWAGTGSNAKFGGGMFSNVESYRLLFSQSSTLYTIPVLEGIRNPSQLTTKTYAASSYHVSSWFDGGYVNSPKNAVSVLIRTSGCSATETVVVKYRVDRATTALAATWTTLATITSNGEAEYTFASGAGVSFKDIQFRIELARGGTTTSTPTVIFAVLKYEKLGRAVWSYAARLDCSRDYAGQSASVLIAYLEALVSTTTLTQFSFNENLYYVRIKQVQAVRDTGSNDTGLFDIVISRMV